MELVHPFARHSPDGTLILGVQTSPRQVHKTAEFMARAWARDLPRAQSFTLLELRHTDYYGRPVACFTGYAQAVVRYYSSLREGEHPVSVETSTGAPEKST
jgi:hypothetical protein